MKRRLLIVALAAVCLLAGCGGGVFGQIQPSSGETDGEGYHLIFVCPIQQNEYWESCVMGMETASRELGITVDVVGPQTAYRFAEEIVGYMEDAIEAKPDGIMVYSGIEALEPLIDRAAAEGIPVLSVDSDAPDTSRIAYVGSDARNLGVKAGETLIKLTGGRAKLGVLTSTLSSKKEQEILGAVQDAVHDYDITIVAVAETDADPDVSEEMSLEMLEEHPEITAIFGTAGYDVTGAARAKQDLELDDLVLLGFDDVEENLDFIRAGVIDGILVQSPEQMGYRGVYVLREYLENGKLPRDSYDTGSLLVTQYNVDTYALSGQTAEETGKVVRVGYYSGDPSFQDGFSDGERKSGYAYEYLQTLSALTGWQYEYVYGTRTEAMDLLAAGEVDIVAGVYRTGDMAQQVFYSSHDMGMYGSERYIAVSRTRSDLMAELNDAMDKLLQAKPNYTLELWQQYYGNQTFSLALTEAECDWLDSRQSLRAGYVRDSLPISAEGSDGMPTGVVKDILEFVASFTVVPIRPVCYDTMADMEAALAAGEIDVAFPVYSDLWLAETKGFRQTDPIVKDRVVALYSGEYSDRLLDRVALSQAAQGPRQYLARYYPNAEVTLYKSRDLALDAVLRGEQNCVVGSSSIMDHVLNASGKYQNLNVVFLDEVEEFGMAVRDEDNILVGILNKAVARIDEATISDAMIKYSNDSSAPTLQDLFRYYAVYIIVALALFFAILLVVFIAYLYRVRAFNAAEEKARAALNQALAAANAASESKTTFLSSMSHDIRTPMNAIIGMTAIASLHLDDRPRVEDCLKKITLASKHLLSLINDVLDISKIESGKLTLNPIAFSLRDTVSSLTDLVRTSVQGKHLQFDVRIHDIRHETVLADEVRLNQVMINILSNAVKYTDEGGRVTMELTERELPEGNQARFVFVVEDSGIGMTPEFMETMYDTFTRASDTRTSKIQGTGLGLAIVKRIVDMVDGTIECQSAPGEGTRFTVTLDLEVTAEEERQPLPDAYVLLVDGDPAFLEDAVKTVRSLGPEADAASDLAGALALLRAHGSREGERTVVLVDRDLAAGEGADTLRELRQAAGDGPCAVLSLSYDWREDGDGDEAGDFVPDGALCKPLFRSYLYEKLTDLFQLHSASAGEKLAADRSFAGLRFLVAEDNELNWEVISELLDMEGISTERAENGQVCVDMLKAAPPDTYDLVLMDVQMPVLTGWNATKVIRADPREDLRRIPIIAMTADAFSEDVETSMRAGMNGHISKPVDMSVLLHEVRRLLGR